MGYRYYITNPVIKDNYPEPKNNSIEEICGFREERYVDEIESKAHGYIEYSKPLGHFDVINFKLVAVKTKTLHLKYLGEDEWGRYVYEDENTRHIETITQIPKTMTSFRTVPIPNSIILKLKSIRNKKGLLFFDENNEVLKAKNVSYKWKKILQACDIPHKKFHSIRHTYASTLLKNGVDIQTVAELMGHSAIAITQIYLHSSDEQKHDAVSKLNYLF